MKDGGSDSHIRNSEFRHGHQFMSVNVSSQNRIRVHGITTRRITVLVCLAHYVVRLIVGKMSCHTKNGQSRDGLRYAVMQRRMMQRVLRRAFPESSDEAERKRIGSQLSIEI